MASIKIEDIRAELEKDGWKLISDSYKNLDQELIYECAEGHKVYGPWKKFRNKRECPICGKNQFTNLTNKVITKPKGAKRIIALDQATHLTGYSVFDNGELVYYSVFETTKSDEIERCREIKMWLLSLIATWHPDKIGLEGIQFQTTANGQRSMGVTTFETLAHLQGILMEACLEAGVSYEVVHTSKWRSYCGVKGKTRTDKKRSMQILVKKWYDVSVTDDEADAIGLGKYVAENYMQNVTIENWEMS